MINPTFFNPAVVKCFASIRLQAVGFSSLSKNLVKRFHQSHPGFGLQKLYPRLLGQHVQNHEQQVPRLYLAKGCTSTRSATHPPSVQSTYNHRESRKTTASGFTQSVSQIPFQDTLDPFYGDLISTGKALYSALTAFGPGAMLTGEPLL